MTTARPPPGLEQEDADAGQEVAWAARARFVKAAAVWVASREQFAKMENSEEAREVVTRAAKAIELGVFNQVRARRLAPEVYDAPIAHAQEGVVVKLYGEFLRRLVEEQEEEEEAQVDGATDKARVKTARKRARQNGADPESDKSTNHRWWQPKRKLGFWDDLNLMFKRMFRTPDLDHESRAEMTALGREAARPIEQEAFVFVVHGNPISIEDGVVWESPYLSSVYGPEFSVKHLFSKISTRDFPFLKASLLMMRTVILGFGPACAASKPLTHNIMFADTLHDTQVRVHNVITVHHTKSSHTFFVIRSWTDDGSPFEIDPNATASSVCVTRVAPPQPSTSAASLEESTFLDDLVFAEFSSDLGQQHPDSFDVPSDIKPLDDDSAFLLPDDLDGNPWEVDFPETPMAKRKQEELEGQGGQEGSAVGEGSGGAAGEGHAGDGTAAPEAKKARPEVESEALEQDEVVAEEEEEEEDYDDEDVDGVSFVLRNTGEMEKMLTEGKALPELNAAAAGKEEEEGAEGNEDGDKEDGEEGKEEDEAEAKFKYSHGKVRKYAPLPGRAGEVTARNFSDYATELGKRNTPFEINLEQMVDKPWARFNASLDDFFNFGFNEETWKEYAARQVGLRIAKLEGAI
ncbi:Pre-mRNA polyadenylation factor fip1 [Durusdinium trenchii]|uniref:Pre-mRNA polyadenylation factor fip1 n=1 Tax=Durusdinium trenchii TaxID=1381693 RepID=A0ABP0LPR3_9DINO